MTGKFSPDHTYVLEDADLEELDEQGMTVVLGEITASLERDSLQPASDKQGQKDEAGVLAESDVVALLDDPDTGTAE